MSLADLAAGARARFERADLDGPTARYLGAVGLTPAADVRVCKAGEPCIIQVRSTRIGLSRHVARRILVIPAARP